MTTKLSGTYTAIVTPFSADASTVDYASLDSLIEFQIAEGVDGLVVCGSTGEAATLDDEEYEKVVRHTCERVRGRVPVVGGVGSNATKRAVQMAKLLERCGVNIVMVVAPPYNKPPQEGILAHVREVRRNVGLPLICYNVPGRTGVNILPKTLTRMADEGLINGIKEASGVMDQILDLLATVRERVAVFSGDDSLTHSVMAAGGTGIISVLANVAPKLMNAITHAALTGRWTESREAQYKALPFCRGMFLESNPIPVKAALALRGIIKSSAVRMPLIAAETSTVEKLTTLMETL